MVADFSHLSPVDEVEDFLHEVVQKDGFAQAEAKISKRVQRWALFHNFEETDEEIKKMKKKKSEKIKIK